MPRKKTSGRGANGNGTIRKITATRNGKEYTYWQARYTEGYDLGTGKQIQRSITGTTQKEVAQRLKEATLDIEHGVYHMLVSRILRQSSHIFCPIVKQKFDLVMHQHPRPFFLLYLPAPLLQ